MRNITAQELVARKADIEDEFESYLESLNSTMTVQELVDHSRYGTAPFPATIHLLARELE